MSGCKQSIWKFLAVVAPLALMLPRLAFGQLGICPPYSKIFGPDDPPGDIVAFINSASVRPGGATVRLLPGEYGLAGLTPVSGVLCIQGVEGTDDARAHITESDLIVAPGGLLTLRSADVPFIHVREGAYLFALQIEQMLDRRSIGLTVDAGGFAQVDASVMKRVENAGRLILTNSEITGTTLTTLYNSGTLYLGQVAVHHNIPAPHKYTPGDLLDNLGVASVWGSTIARNDGAESFGPIVNLGYFEIRSSIVAENFGYGYEVNCYNEGEFVDLGDNVFSPAGLLYCDLTEPTSVTADPEFVSDFATDWSGPVELGAGSPAIDRIPLALCSETDALGRARTDGNGDGIVACDSGALEYGHAFVEATIRARPYHWREVGTIDLSTTSLMTIYVLSSETFDATEIVFASVEIEGFDPDAKGWPWTLDVFKDGLMDYQVTWWLSAQPPLPCGYQEHQFSAVTEDGTAVRGLLKFDAVGCTP